MTEGLSLLYSKNVKIIYPAIGLSGGKDQGYRNAPYFGLGIVEFQKRTVWVRTDDYPIFVNHPKPTKEEFLKVMTIAHNYIKSSKIESCQVIVTQLENRWDVMCDPASSTELKCDFRIDAKSFDVINQKPPQ